MARSNWAFVIRNSSFVILTVASFCFSPSANAQASAIGVDGIDCITADNASEGPLQIADNSSDPANDLDEISLPSNDKATIPSRNDQTTPQFTTTAIDAIALRQPGLVPAFLLSAHSSFCLCEHLRERAPPRLV
jgi:hypothetical protein